MFAIGRLLLSLRLISRYINLVMTVNNKNICKMFVSDTSKRSGYKRQRHSRTDGQREICIESIANKFQKILQLLTNRQIVELKFEFSVTIFHSSTSTCLRGCHENHNFLRFTIFRNKKHLLILQRETLL